MDLHHSESHPFIQMDRAHPLRHLVSADNSSKEVINKAPAKLVGALFIFKLSNYGKNSSTAATYARTPVGTK